MVHIVDWFPTLLSLAGHQLTTETDGLDIWRTLTGDEEVRTSFVYNIDIDDQSDTFQLAVRRKEYKLVWGQEELLKQREAELEEREMTLLQRELNIMIHQQQPQVTTPMPKKRKGKFRKRLLKKEPSTASNSMISGPSGESCRTLCNITCFCFSFVCFVYFLCLQIFAII